MTDSTDTTTEIIHAVSTEQLRELLQEMGCRVSISEQNGQKQLLSATQGIGFSVRPGNPAPEAERFLDYTLSCALRVQGALPEGVETSWNSSKRFARLTAQGDFLVLEMDVVVAGGVTRAALRANAELWDRLLQEFLLFLRQYAQTNASSEAAAVANTDDASRDAAPPVADEQPDAESSAV
ncbi:hypothetical protein B7P02_15670 [Bordetella bronchiseptica]|uniref:YbjN domain-containing protein n=1 Tax=Bordetella bronchiseptica TaxID=518 RepID=UPI000D73E8B2|nr:YbjN domain-containing protein [Bordetella bronchiseptica]AWP59364.1 hypothetical protein B7P02_15670 [Bordetella bronchiseptica]